MKEYSVWLEGNIIDRKPLYLGKYKGYNFSQAAWNACFNAFGKVECREHLDVDNDTFRGKRLYEGKKPAPRRYSISMNTFKEYFYTGFWAAGHIQLSFWAMNMPWYYSILPIASLVGFIAIQHRKS